MIPGEYIVGEGQIKCNATHESILISVINTGDRPIQVGSHFHFFEANKSLLFDREKAFGKRMDILAGTAKRFEPGEPMEIALIPLSGVQKAFGGNNLVQGDAISEKDRDKAMEKLHAMNFKHTTDGL